MLFTNNYHNKKITSNHINRPTQVKFDISNLQNYNSTNHLTYNSPRNAADIKNLTNSKQFILTLEQVKKSIISFIKLQISDFQKGGNISNTKTQIFKKIQTECQTLQITILSFAQFLQRVYLNGTKSFISFQQFQIDPNEIQNNFHKMLKQEYQALIDENTKLTIKMNQEFSNLRIKMKRIQQYADNLQNQNFSLKQKLEAKSKRCLILELERMNNFQTNKSQPRINIIRSNPSISPENFTFNKQNQQGRKNMMIQSNRNNFKLSKSDDKPVFATKSKQKTPPKKSPFNFKPCIQLWKKQGIHSDKIKQLTECNQCKIYQQQIQFLNKKIQNFQNSLR